MEEHQRLVNALVDAFRERGYEILNAVGVTAEAPFAIGRHEPDLIARDPSGLLLIGEAKTGEDISELRSREQFTDFSNRIMSEGLLKGREIPFHIIVPQAYSNLLRQVLDTLGLTQKIGSRIIIWTS